MRPLNKAWIASGVGNLHKLVFDEVKQRWVMPAHTTAAELKRKAKRDQYSKQCEAIGNALASMHLELRPTRVAKVSPLVGAAVRARCDALSALGGAASLEQQLATLDSVAAVFEKEGVSLAELGRSRPLAEQLVIHAEWVQRIPEACGAVKRQRQDMSPEQRKAQPGVQTTRAPRTRLTCCPSSQEQFATKKRKTRQDNKLTAAQNGTKHDDPWSSDELKKLLQAFEACGNRWKDVASRVGSRTWSQCKGQYSNLKKAGRLEPISEDTPLREKIFPGFGKAAIKKFAKCKAKINGERITTVGQLAKLDLDISKEANKLYLLALTGQTPSHAVRMAEPWKAKAIEAIAFWQ